ncbi:MAG: hypothetical protein LBV41_11990 [Cytophagaceae bacterium]|jgi:transcriptional regulator of arginine metabolism|nr:hypothetical protein [Cytophagaceae bacterium]
MKIKDDRLNIVASTISSHKVRSQEELLTLLEKEGVATTQATLSRDLKMLKITKQPDDAGEYVYVIPATAPVHRNEMPAKDNIFKKGLLSIEFSGNIAVLKTRPAFASLLAQMIDKCNLPEVAGTIAGIDTIFVVKRENITNEKLLKSFSVSLNCDINL